MLYINYLNMILSSSKRNLRIPLIYHAIGYLTHTINFNCAIRADKKLFLQSQCNVNIMFKMKKSMKRIIMLNQHPKEKRSNRILKENK